ncbi:Gfo/Idh/MocA family oxidoreductase [Streptomyces sp. NPDC006553]|uniref:Gfo/Idh/MocA family protein n=1 Tax=Streptomyces sp. NPDC006553 TaxID=3157180 RepID=UPI0033AA6E12
MSRPLRLGLLGCADIAVRRMLPAVAAHPDLEIAVIGSRDPDRAKAVAERFGGRPAAGYDAVLAAEDVDLVYAPVPAALHETWVSAALEAGKHVLAEKPLTLDAEHTRRLLDRAADRGLALVENVLFVHHPQHEAVRRLVADGAIGELHSLHAMFTIPEPPEDDIRHRPELGGGALWDVGVYPLRAALHLLGPRLTVTGAVLTAGTGRRVDTAGAALLRTPDGVTAQLTFGMAHAYRARYELHGSTGRITVDRAYTPAADLAPLVRLHGPDGSRDIPLAPADQVERALTALVTAVRGRSAPDPAVLRQAELLSELRRYAGPPDPTTAGPGRPGPIRP